MWSTSCHLSFVNGQGRSQMLSSAAQVYMVQDGLYVRWQVLKIENAINERSAGEYLHFREPFFLESPNVRF